LAGVGCGGRRDGDAVCGGEEELEQDRGGRGAAGGGGPEAAGRGGVGGEGRARLPGRLGKLAGERRRASTVEDRDLRVSCLNPLLMSTLLCLIGSERPVFRVAFGERRSFHV
jgi:hypothetical protein